MSYNTSPIFSQLRISRRGKLIWARLGGLSDSFRQEPARFPRFAGQKLAWKPVKARKNVFATSKICPVYERPEILHFSKLKVDFPVNTSPYIRFAFIAKKKKEQVWSKNRWIIAEMNISIGVPRAHSSNTSKTTELNAKMLKNTYLVYEYERGTSSELCSRKFWVHRLW